MAVTGTITITTLLFFYIARHQWKWPLWVVLPSAGLLLLIDGLFLAANVTKISHGAWLPLLIALAVFTVMTTWQRGRELVTTKREREEGTVWGVIQELHDDALPVVRVPGTAVFLNRNKVTAPLAMRANIEHNHVLHDHVVLLTIQTIPVPHIPESDRLIVDDLGYNDDGITFVGARFGYQDQPDIPAVLELVEQAGAERPVDVHGASYFVSKIELRVGDEPGLPRWRKRLFVATSHLSGDASDSFCLPRDRTVIIGAEIDV
jgi:KUP system potassium uptake protein